jgi:hypothetical protein
MTGHLVVIDDGQTLEASRENLLANKPPHLTGELQGPAEHAIIEPARTRTAWRWVA